MCNEAALAIDRQRGDAIACAADLTNLGAVLQHLGDHERTLVCLEEALRLDETTQGSPRPGRLTTIGLVHRKLGDHERTLAYYQRAYESCGQNCDKQGQIFVLIHMAPIYWEQGKTDDSLRLSAAAIYEQTIKDCQEACATWEKVWALRLQMGDRHGALEALQQVGRLARQRLSEPTQALRYLHDALDLAVELGDRAKQGEQLNTLGIMAWQQAAYADGLAHYERARTTGRSQEERQARAKQTIEVAESMPGVVWICSYRSESEGKTYCIYEAPNPEAIMEHARRVGLSVLKIIPISMEVDPSMFR